VGRLRQEKKSRDRRPKSLEIAEKNKRRGKRERQGAEFVREYSFPFPLVEEGEHKKGEMKRRRSRTARPCSGDVFINKHRVGGGNRRKGDDGLREVRRWGHVF